MDHLKKSKLFAGISLILLAGLTIWVYTNIPFIFRPLEAVFSTLFLPLLIATFLYYIFLPLYQRIEALVKKSSIAVPLVMVIMGLLLLFGIQILVPALISETAKFAAQVPELLTRLAERIDHSIMEEHLGTVADSLDIKQISNFAIQFVVGATTSISSLVSFVSHSAIILFTIPLLLVYLFKDGTKIPDLLVTIVPRKYHPLTRALCRDFHTAAAAYIGGKLLVCLYVAGSSYLVFSLLGLPNPFLLGLICGALDIIPYFGPFIGAAPALLFAFGEDAQTAILLIVGITIIQFGESYLVSPMVMKKAIHIHPVVAVFLLLVAGNLVGFLGMIVALPIYSIITSMIRTLIAYRKESAFK